NTFLEWASLSYYWYSEDFSRGSLPYWDSSAVSAVEVFTVTLARGPHKAMAEYVFLRGFINNLKT
ncbi:hypothetical protein L9F63_024579, partial [Diploptera punctata]